MCMCKCVYVDCHVAPLAMIQIQLAIIITPATSNWQLATDMSWSWSLLLGLYARGRILFPRTSRVLFLFLLWIWRFLSAILHDCDWWHGPS
jgi:hypothetical protein